MYLTADILYFIVVALHVYFVALEMVLWKKMAPKVFGVSQEYANQSAAMASNQGLYNLFLVAALLIGYFADLIDIGAAFMIYGLVCVVLAGIWGGITINKRIFFVQAVPAILALGIRVFLAL